VIFTSGGTEANNLALHAAPALVTSALEHPSVTRMAEVLEAGGRPVRWLPVPPSGRLRAEDVAAALVGLPAGAIVAVAAANHESGVIQPISEIAAAAHAAGARLHVDAVQAVGKLSSSELEGADTLAVAAHKIRGPKASARWYTAPSAHPNRCWSAGPRSAAAGLAPSTPSPPRGFGSRRAGLARRSELAPPSPSGGIGSSASSSVGAPR
jgi:cysteine desulfurase